MIEEDPRNMFHPGSEESKLMEAQVETDASGFLKRLALALKALLKGKDDA